MSTTGSPGTARSNAVDDLEDGELVGIVRRGLLLGVPLVYAISLLVALPGAGWPLAPLIAVLPALFAGPWLGSTVMLMTYRRPARVTTTGTVVPLGDAPPAARRPVGRAA